MINAYPIALETLLIDADHRMQNVVEDAVKLIIEMAESLAGAGLQPMQ